MINSALGWKHEADDIRQILRDAGCRELAAPDHGGFVVQAGTHPERPAFAVVCAERSREKRIVAEQQYRRVLCEHGYTVTPVRHGGYVVRPMPVQ